jgi:hypothetical protein
MPEVEKTSIFGTAVHAVLRSAGVSADDIAARLRQSGHEAVECSPVEPSLEDVFLEVAASAEGPRP